MKTPFYVIDVKKLQKNIQSFVDGMSNNWSNTRLAYSVKTNSLPWIVEFMNKNKILAEVVSDEEYDLAIMCGFDEKNIIFNGPIKGSEHIKKGIKSGSYVNIDSESDIQTIEANDIASARVGIRINVPPHLFDEKDIEYKESGFRFGFSVENGDFERVLTRLENRFDTSRVGLHVHCNSITRSTEVYKAISRYVVEISNKYSLKPLFVDIGGGFFGGVPGKTEPSEYFDVISKELKKTVLLKDTEIIAEPGSAIIGSAVDLYSSVIDVKDTVCSRVVTTDGSRVLLDPLWKKKSYYYRIEQSYEDDAIKDRQIICGYTCMDHDRIMTLNNEKELHVGDIIIYNKVGAYTMTFGGPFIRYYPEVYLRDGKKMNRVRARMSVKDYYSINKETLNYE